MLDDIFQLSRHLIRIRDRAYRRYFIRTTPFKSRCSILIGQRGVGKTTSLIQHLVDAYPEHPTSRECLYVQADHIGIGDASLFRIAQDFVNVGGKLLCLDEIHKAQDWSRELKSITDTFPSLKIVASGSSILEVHRGSHDLSRRVVVYRMTGMSFREFLELRLDLVLPTYSLATLLETHESAAPNIITAVEDKQAKILGMFQDYLRFGYYPYFFEYEDPDIFRITLEQNVHTAIEIDLPAVHPTLGGSTVKKIRKLMAVISASVPFTPNFGKLKPILDVADDRTLKTYLRYLEEAGLIMVLTKEGRGMKALQKPEKIYLGDPNQVWALHPAGRPNIGNIRETYFFRMLSFCHALRSAGNGDFLADDEIVFEVGGRNKTLHQVKGKRRAFLALDDIETGIGRKIPLWLFGFLY